jgi:hypothetical protein
MSKDIKTLTQFKEGDLIKYKEDNDMPSAKAYGYGLVIKMEDEVHVRALWCHQVLGHQEKRIWTEHIGYLEKA